MENICKIIVLALCLMLPQSAFAKVLQHKRFSNWVYLDVQYLSGKISCQATQCISEHCSLNKNFLFNAGRGQRLAVPEFNQGAEYPTNSTVQLNIGNKSFKLTNSNPKNKRFYFPKTGNEVIQINRLLLSLAKTTRNGKFHVIDRNGQKRVFSVRGLDRVFSEIERKCGVPLP